MAWSAPLTAVSNTSLTAAQWNATVRDNLNESPMAKATTSGSHFAATGANAIAERVPATASLLTLDTTTSSGYVGAMSGGTSGPQVIVACGTKALVSWHVRQSSSVAGTNVWTSYAIGVPTSLGGNDQWSVSYDQAGQIYHGITVVETGVVAGTQAFQMQFRVSGGTGTFASRRINVVPF
jgi:hypothetical protein